MFYAFLLFGVFRLCVSVEFQCSSQITMDPEIGGHPQYVGENPPPYSFQFLDESGQPVKKYSDKTYTIKLSAYNSYFRSFLIQARLATKHGHIVGGFRAGQFSMNPDEKAVKFLTCPSLFNDSITNVDNDKKLSIEVKWKPSRNDGPIQFLITIIQEEAKYWVAWAPKSGLIYVDKNAQFADTGKSANNAAGDVSIPKLETPNTPEPVTDAELSEGETTAAAASADDLTTRRRRKHKKTTTVAPTTTTTQAAESEEKSGESKEKASEEKSGSAEKKGIAPFPAPPTPGPSTSPPAVEVKTTIKSASVDSDEESGEKVPESKLVPPPGEDPKNVPARFIVSSNVSSSGENTGKQEGTVDKSSFLNKFVETPKEAPKDPSASRVVDRGPRPKGIDESQIPKQLLEEHFLETRANVTDAPDLDMCEGDPCLHNGTCESFPGERRYQCTCTGKWTGESCEEPNLCFNNDCKNNAACVLGEGEYTCQCADGWGGRRCELSCPSYLCQNGGSCTIADNGQYKCACKPGWAGEKCEKQSDLCESSPCLNGGNCTNKVTSFECRCKPGYFGDRCHRACQDVYRSCDSWKQEDKCDGMRPTTSFFDINCPVSCDQCTFDNSTIKTLTPLPFLLEPFAFLIGTWYATYSSPLRYPLDFDYAPQGYSEELSFFVPPVSMFGTPYLNYTSKSFNKAYYNEAQTNVGFATLKPLTDPAKVAIMSTGNDGLTMIEEGEIKPNTMTLKVKFINAYPAVQKIPLKLSRKFHYDGSYLEEKITRTRADGVTETFSRYYTKHDVPPYY